MPGGVLSSWMECSFTNLYEEMWLPVLELKFVWDFFLGKTQIKSSQLIKGQLGLVNCKKDKLGHRYLIHINKFGQMTQMPKLLSSSQRMYSVVILPIYIYIYINDELKPTNILGR